MKSFEERIEQLNKIINESKNIVFFGGAGVSTASGIPDFRSKDGLYNTPNVGFEKYSPEYLLSSKCLWNETEVFYEFYKQKLDCRNIEPNDVHKKLAEMEKMGKLSCIVTQNIDGLHEKAGSKKIYNIHGTTYENYCVDCGAKYDVNYIFEGNLKRPTCKECGGLVRPNVTLYGESLPQDFYSAQWKIDGADTLIVAGTSLTVYPAANLVRDFYGKNLVLINRDSTSYDSRATLVFHEDMAEVFKGITI